MKNILIAVLLSSVCCSFCFGQNTSIRKFDTIKIDTIPDIKSFEKLTLRESYIDTMLENSYWEREKLIKNAINSNDSASEEEKAKALEYYRDTYVRYKDNRSRYYLESYKNNKLENAGNRSSSDTLTTDCNCYLEGDTLKVVMGIWLLGGFYFSLDIATDQFSGNYWLNYHKQKILKSKLTDSSWRSEANVEFEKQTLILTEKPQYRIGESVTGFLLFKTNDYYLASDKWNPDKKIDTLYLRGTIHFKCKVKKILDRWY